MCVGIAYLTQAKVNYNYVKIEEINELKYEDLRFPATTARILGASNIPDFEVLKNNTYTLAFSPTTMEQAFLTMQFPHNRISNTTILPHFHWTTKTAGVGNVTWCLEYTCANVNGVLPFTETRCVTDLVEEPFKHQMTEMIHINNTFTESAMCGIRIYRDATNINDTFTQDALLLEFDIHYISKQIGEPTH